MADIKFGTSGLRGPAVRFSAELTGAYIAAFLDSCCQGSRTREVAIGMDLRSSSPDIAGQVSAAIVRHDFQPLNLGELPTPALASFCLSQKLPGIMVTGSHIPEDYNGLKFYRPQGELRKHDEGPIELVVAAARIQPMSPATYSGSMTLPEVTPDARANYIKRYLAAFPHDILAGLSVGVFEHSAVGRDIVVEILQSLGARVTGFGRTENFVAVDTEALESDHLALVRAALGDYNLDAVVSTDGDGDRPLVIDETGNQINGDILGALTARFLGAETIITPLTSTSAIELSGWFQAVHRTRIGSPYVIEMMEKCDDPSVVGFEANGGFLTGTNLAVGNASLERLPTRDAILPIIAVLAMAQSQNCKLSQLRKTLPQRVMLADRLRNIPSSLSAPFIAEMIASSKARQQLDASLAKPVSIDTQDGARLTLTDDTIIHFRASGNAPELRCYVETDSTKKTQKVLDKMIGKLDKIMKSRADR